MRHFSKNEIIILGYIIKKIDGYLATGLHYRGLPGEILAALRSIEAWEDSIEPIFENCGTLKLIEAEAIYDGLEELVPPYKDYFENCLSKIKKFLEEQLEKTLIEPEDPYAWPFEEYK